VGLSSDGIDFDNDGTPEIFVTTGMLTNESETDLRVSSGGSCGRLAGIGKGGGVVREWLERAESGGARTVQRGWTAVQSSTFAAGGAITTLPA
jgi:hypothetical protein